MNLKHSLARSRVPQRRDTKINNNKMIAFKIEKQSIINMFRHNLITRKRPKYIHRYIHPEILYQILY